MKKLILGVALIGVALALIVVVKPAEAKKDACATIQGGTIFDTKGNQITIGYDQFGYNYQSHMFNGRYCDYDRVIGGTYCDVNLVMKWNDAWLSNKDCDDDGLLDRHYGFDSYIGSGAWETNHQWGDNDDGTNWNYFVKIVAVPADAYRIGPAKTGIWYTADDVEIGTDIWGSYAKILQISNDPALDEHGVLNNWEAPTGFGFYK